MRASIYNFSPEFVLPIVDLILNISLNLPKVLEVECRPNLLV